MSYFLWIPVVVLWYFVYYYFSIRNNISDQIWYECKWFWLTLFLGWCPLWAIVSRVSNRIVFDGLLYDSLLVIIFPLSMIVFEQTTTFTVHHYIGMLMIVFGLILLKI